MVEPPDWMEILSEIGPRLLFRLPEVALFFAALLAAYRCWNWDRRVAGLVLVGGLLLLLGVLCYEVGWVLMWKRPELFGLQPRRWGVGRPWLQLACSFMTAAGGLLLLVALVIKRQPKINVSWDTELDGKEP
jgi:hypothetical protein